MSASEFVIETHGLCRRYGARLALDGLTLKVPRGQIHAIVGANGAGKSTLFRILLGFLSPSSGEARILGRDCRDLSPDDRARIGFVNEEHTLPDWRRVAEITAAQRKLYPHWNQSLFDEVIGHYHVHPGQRVRELSRGERAGFNLALALAQAPELLILDEPTLGLDVVARRAFLEALMYRSSGTDCTVVYCSHQMDEIERVADQLILLERGQLRAMATPEELVARVSYWVAEFPFMAPDPRTLPGLLQQQRIDGLQHYLVLDQDPGYAEFLRSLGARSVRAMAVGLDRAVNALLAQHHAAPAA